MTGRSGAVRAALRAACAAAAFACAPDDAGVPAIRFDDDPASPTYGAVDLVATDAVLRALEARAVQDGWTSVLAVHTEGASAADPPVLGDHSMDGGRLRFMPRFPPVKGQGYRVRIDASTPAVPDLVLDTIVRVERTARPPATRVLRVHPAGDRLPANLLRMYIEFSAPMSVGEAHERVRLLDDGGTVAEDALLVVPQELWDPDRRRLTVLLDPGRIKRGLRPNQELGMPLSPGASYTLVIDDTWSDADGLPLREGHRRTFTVIEPDRDVPAPAQWRIDAPRTGSREPVVVRFDEALDWGLLHRLLSVHTPAGDPVQGDIVVADDATSWTFTPASPWVAGGYVVRVRTDLEDVAGNNLRAPFDVDRQAPPEPAATGESIDLPFIVR